MKNRTPAQTRGRRKQRRLRLLEEEVLFNVEEDNGYQFIDDVHGKVLNSQKVREARKKEMDYFKKLYLYVKELLTVNNC